MSAFLTACLLAAPVDGSREHWLLMATLIYQSDAAKCAVIVPAGFKTDLASVPRVPVIYEMVGNIAPSAAVVHDWLYSDHMLSRSMADEVLREACALLGVKRWQCWVLWAGVRLAGRAYWRKR